jgi:uncharacterized protein (TIGR02145 family)
MTGFFIKTFIAFFTVLLAISCSDNSVTDPDDLAASTWGSGSSSSDTSVVLLSGGCFEMGSTDGSSDETPVHKVCVSPFYMDRHEVTNAEYIAAMGDSAHFDDDKCGIYNADSVKALYGTLPASFRGNDQPMVCVDWSQAEAYCESQGKRLPTEAEWEYAARAGTTTDYFWGSVVTGGCAYGNITDKTKLLDGLSWSPSIQCTDGYGEVTSPVGSFSPNPWGLYDMTGNVWEGTHDWYDDSSYYATSPATNPWGPSAGTYRVNRGGAWNSLASWLRVSARSWATPDYSDNALGFRCVASNATPGSASSLSSSSYGASSSSVYTNPNISYGSFTDSRDSKTYRTVEIGTQTWMAENLNYKTDSSWCYGNKDSNCSKYGRLYSWAAAMGLSSSYNKSLWGGSDVNHQGICPSGWHLPSDSEWTVLANYVSQTSNMGNMDDYGSWSAIGQLLKTNYGWHDTTSSGTGTNAFGFAALAGGVIDSSGSFMGDSLLTAWWSSTENKDIGAVDIILFYSDDSLSRGTDIKAYDYSVRCVMDPAGLSSSSAIGSSSSSMASSSSVGLSSSSNPVTFRDTSFSIAEDSKRGTVIGTLQASDDSKEKLTWVLINETMFSLDSNRLILNGPLDYEGTFIYQLRAFVQNGEGFSDTATITVQVTNVNEAPVFTAALDTLSEANGLKAGTVLDTLKASDPDGDIFVFFIRSGNTDNMFGLTSEGVLKLTGTLDYATTPVYNLVVAVTDGSDTVSTPLTIVVDSSRFIDARDGHLYKSVKIGSQTWMAENLAYLPQVDSDSSSTASRYYVYAYTPSSYTESEQIRAAKETTNYKTYGVLYNWPAAMAGAASSSDDPSGVQGACPSGWHLPSTAEWDTLHAYVDLNNGNDGDGYSLKAKTGWNSSGNGSDQFGFSALPAGDRLNKGNFSYLGYTAIFWSATEFGSGRAYYRYLSYNGANMDTNYDGEGNALSIRCVQDL